MPDTVETTQTQEVVPSPFSKEAWAESPTLTNEKPDTPSGAVETPAASSTTETPAAPHIEPKPEEKKEPVTTESWVKEFGWDSEEVAKAEIKKLKETKPAEEIKFENEQSKQIHELLRSGKTKEVRQFLDTQDRIESILSTDVTKDNAESVIKLAMSLKHKDLSEAEINYKYNKEFGTPKEPVQKLEETDEEFAARKQEWQMSISDVEMNKMIEAKLLKPELEKVKTELKLPEVEKPAPQDPKPTQEELDRIKNQAEQFINTLNADYKNFNGYELKYKDEEVEIPVSYAVTDEEKESLRKELENFDVDGFIIGRWFNDKGAPNIKQIMEDVTLLRKKEAVFQKIASEVGTQMRKHYIKAKSNVQLNTTSQQTFQQTQNGNGKVSPYAKDAWSETPPIPQN